MHQSNNATLEGATMHEHNSTPAMSSPMLFPFCVSSVPQLAVALTAAAPNPLDVTSEHGSQAQCRLRSFARFPGLGLYARYIDPQSSGVHLPLRLSLHPIGGPYIRFPLLQANSGTKECCVQTPGCYGHCPDGVYIGVENRGSHRTYSCQQARKSRRCGGGPWS